MRFSTMGHLGATCRRRMLHDLPTQHEVQLDEPAADVAPVVDFLYADHFMTFGNDINRLALCRSLLVIANKYDVPELRMRCAAELASLTLTVDNFPEAYSLAVEHDLEDATRACVLFAMTELEKVIRCTHIKLPLPGSCSVIHSSDFACHLSLTIQSTWKSGQNCLNVQDAWPALADRDVGHSCAESAAGAGNCCAKAGIVHHYHERLRQHAGSPRCIRQRGVPR